MVPYGGKNLLTLLLHKIDFDLFQTSPGLSSQWFPQRNSRLFFGFRYHGTRLGEKVSTRYSSLTLLLNFSILLLNFLLNRPPSCFRIFTILSFGFLMIFSSEMSLSLFIYIVGQAKLLLPRKGFVVERK